MTHADARQQTTTATGFLVAWIVPALAVGAAWSGRWAWTRVLGAHALVGATGRMVAVASICTQARMLGLPAPEPALAAALVALSAFAGLVAVTFALASEYVRGRT